LEEHSKINIPKDTRCEICGMLAVSASKDTQGVTHFYCEHHSLGREEARHEAHGPEEHAGHGTNMFRNRFFISLILTVPVLLYSPLISRIFGFEAPIFTGSFLISPILSTIIFFYGGLVFLKGARNELKSRLPGMMTLIALAISVAYLYSLTTLLYPLLGEPLFWEMSSLITVMLFGHWFEMRAVSSASGALRELAKLLPDMAEKFVSKDRTETVSVDDLAKGDIVLVKPGGQIPSDGTVIEGETDVNESMVTGESLPVSKGQGDKVIAGTVNGTGVIKVRLDKVGEDTALAGIMRLVDQAQASRSRIQDLADRAAYYLTLTAVGIGTLTMVVWVFLLERDLAFSLQRTVAVLVITCPHALGLAIPLVTSISTTISARSGILIREKLALELARNTNVVLFDKTGTLTSGDLGVTDLVGTRSFDEDKVLQWAASLEQGSEHAVAGGIVRAARDKKINFLKVKNVKAVPGKGIRGTIQSKEVYVGGPALLSELKKKVPAGISPSLERIGKEGKTVVYLFVSGKIVGALGVADTVRPESRQAVEALHKLGVRVAMVTGDAEPVARGVAKYLGIDEYFAEVLPEDKEKMVRKIQKEGNRVMMVGDGINDAPALASADVGIAIGAGTDVAIESAGIVLIKNDPRDVVKVIKLARANYRKMVENLVWATGYNVFAIPAAAGVFISLGIVLSPALSALFMSASTIIVAANAQLLRRVQL